MSNENPHKQEEQTPKPLPGGITQDQVEKWKKAHGNVHQIQVESEDKTYTIYLKDPDRNHIKLASSHSAGQRPVEAGEVFLENCWLGGDEDIEEDDKAWVSACFRARTILELPDAAIKKL